MKHHELWLKDNQFLVVGCDPKNEWRYRWDGSTYYISGLSYYELISKGFKLITKWMIE